MRNDIFSIVIPCKNEEAFIGNTLQSVLSQDIFTRDVEVYIADAASTDHTLQVVAGFYPQMNVHVIEGGLPPVGRNHGGFLCSSKYILFMDADIELGSTDMLHKITDTAEKFDLDLVIPRIKVKSANLMDKVFEYSYYLTAKTKMFGAFGAGTFLFIRNETFRKLGGFNEQLPLGDDWDLSHRISADRFMLAETVAYTSNRRFKVQGYLPTFYQWVSVALNRKYREKGHEEYFDNTLIEEKNKAETSR